MDLSIVIPAYSPEKFLGNLFARLEVIDKKFVELNLSSELIFLHNGSTSALAEKIPKLHAIKFKYHEFRERLTPALARNIGINQSVGRFVLFHDVDDLLNLEFPEAFHKLKRFLLLDVASYDLIVFRYRKIKQDGVEVIGHGLKETNFELKARDLESYINRYIQKPHVFTLFVHCWSKLYSRSFLLKHELAFHPKLEQLEDVNFNFRVLNKSPKIYYCGAVCYDYTVATGSSNLSAESGAKGAVDIRSTVKALLPAKEYLQNSIKKRAGVRRQIGHLYATTFVLWLIRTTRRLQGTSKFSEIVAEYVKSRAVQGSMRHYKYLLGTSWVIPCLVVCKMNKLLTIVLCKQFGGRQQ